MPPVRLPHRFVAQLARSASSAYKPASQKGSVRGVDNRVDNSQTELDLAGLPLRETSGTVVFLDVVQSVMIIERDQMVGIQRIRRLLADCSGDLLDQHGGRLLQRMGDGLMLQFESPRSAVAYADAAHALAQAATAALPAPAQPLQLRVGAHRTNLYTDDTAWFGLGVSVAARIAAEALPGETVLSAQVVDTLKPGLDVDIEDLGECELKHLHAPVRLYRAWTPVRPPQARAPQAADDSGRPVVAVFPLLDRGPGQEQAVVGEVCADGLIAELSRVQAFRVISRQTTGLLARPEVQLRASQALAPDYTVSGHVMGHASGLLLWVELRDALSGTVCWADRFATSLSELLDLQGQLLHAISAEITLGIGTHALTRAYYSPLRSLHSCELLFGAIALTGRTSLTDFDRPRVLLEKLIERHPASVLPRVWLAHWYVMRRVQGLTPPGEDDGRQALYMAERSLDLDPHNAHAMATQGFAATHFLRDFTLARQRLDAAIAVDPSCAWAWLYRGALHAFTADGAAAERDCAEALACSPLDPMRHFFLSISATAAFTNRRYDSAVELARASRRHDRYHASTVRVLAMSLALGGRLEEARGVAEELLRIEPHLTVQRYLQRTPSAGFEVGERCAEGLRLAGVPTH